VLEQEDSLPISPEEIAAAVREATESYRAAAIVTFHREEALPLLREAFRSSDGDKRYAYALMLACCLATPPAPDRCSRRCAPPTGGTRVGTTWAWASRATRSARWTRPSSPWA
jgi:hypothetical protein